MINVVVSKIKNIQVSSNNTGGTIQTTTPVILKNNSSIINGSVDNLTDVSIEQKIDGATLVYDIASDSYIIKPLEFQDVVGNFDGGSF
jgi:hypothetical protein